MEDDMRGFGIDKFYRILSTYERYDQKNACWNRIGWDHELRRKGKSITGSLDPSLEPVINDEVGFTAWDHALRRGLSHIDMGYRYQLCTADGKWPWPIAGEKTKITDKEKASGRVKYVARLLGADLVGICDLDKRWIYSRVYNLYRTMFGKQVFPVEFMDKPLEIPEEIRHCISIGVDMGELIFHSPDFRAKAATGWGYSRCVIIASSLARFIRSMGYNAIPCGPGDIQLSIPIAIEAGLGELGRNGMLITPKFGSNIRLATVLTDMPLKTDAPKRFGITEFCKLCKKCAVTCPAGAISFEKERCLDGPSIGNHSVEKWYIDPEKCVIALTYAHTCDANCIRNCPWTKSRARYHGIARWMAKHSPFLDGFLIWLDDFLGYGKRRKHGPYN